MGVVEQLLPAPKPAAARATKLHLLVRTAEQLDAAIALAPASITLDYLDLYGLRPSLDRVKAAGIEARVASPRILKPGEQRIADFLLRCECSDSGALRGTCLKRCARRASGWMAISA